MNIGVIHLFALFFTVLLAPWMTVARLCLVLLRSRGVPLSRDLDLDTSALKELCTLAAKLRSFSVIDLYCSILVMNGITNGNTIAHSN